MYMRARETQRQCVGGMYTVPDIQGVFYWTFLTTSYGRDIDDIDLQFVCKLCMKTGIFFMFFFFFCVYFSFLANLFPG